LKHALKPEKTIILLAQTLEVSAKLTSVLFNIKLLNSRTQSSVPIETEKNRLKLAKCLRISFGENGVGSQLTAMNHLKCEPYYVLANHEGKHTKKKKNFNSICTTDEGKRSVIKIYGNTEKQRSEKYKFRPIKRAFFMFVNALPPPNSNNNCSEKRIAQHSITST
jgi:hypothetical protein